MNANKVDDPNEKKKKSSEGQGNSVTDIQLIQKMYGAGSVKVNKK